MSKPVEVTDADFDEFVNNNPKVVVDCWAAWCAPCRMLAPTLDEIASEKPDVKFAKLDVDKNRAVPTKYGIMSIPTLLYFKDGKLVDKSLGALPKTAIESKLVKLE